MNSTLWKSLMAVLTTLVLATAAPAADTDKTTAKGKEEEPETNFLVTPQLRMISVSGDQDKFREHSYMREGLTGGIEEFSWRQMFGKKKDILMEIEGRGLYDDEDYMLKLLIEKPDFGFVRSGFTQYRKYFDDSGGYYAPFRTPYFELDRDLSLTMGNWYVDFGLTLPNFPKITLGFEHQSKEGDKSMLEWGSVSQTFGATSISKNIYPTYKGINESVDIFKADVDYNIGKVHMGDNFRYEIYDNNTTRSDDTGINLTNGQAKPIRVHEDFNHDQFSNAYFVESHINDKVYVSGGHLYTSMRGDASFENTTSYVGGAPVGGTDKFWHIEDADLDQESHVLNANIMVGPFWGTSLYAGVQAEQTYVDSFSDSFHAEGGVFPGPNVVADTSSDKERLQENVGVRFTKIPFTVVYGEARWTRESNDVRRDVLDDGLPDFDQRTDGDIERDEYTFGFSTSPIRRASLTAQYRNSSRRNSYDHEVDTTLNGYPAFITEQDFRTDEISAKLTVRPHNRVSATLKFQLIDSNIDTETMAGTNPANVPGGSINASNYRANIYSISATFTPMNRLYLTGFFSLTDSETSTYDHNSRSTVPFKNNVYTGMGSVVYGIDEKTDATVEYMFQRTSNFDNNSWNNASQPITYPGYTINVDTGLPMAIYSTRQVFSAGISRRITKNITARLRYGYFKYDESHNNDMNDYEAHMALATCAIRF